MNKETMFCFQCEQTTGCTGKETASENHHSFISS